MLSSLLALILLASSSFAEVKFSLDSDQWTLENQNKSIHLNGKVPGGVYTDLQAGGVLNGSLFYRQNDHEFRWVSKENWTYSRTFDIAPEVLQKTVLNLVLHGVDTVGEVFLNGQLLGSVDNMFIRYVFPIKEIAKETYNTVEVRLQSPILTAAALAQAQPYQVPPACVPDGYQGECHANMLRKMQASFSWDWGPAFPSAGLWKSVEIEGLDVGVIRDVVVATGMFQEDNVDYWQLNFTLYAHLATETFAGVLVAELTDPESKIIQLRKSFKTTNENHTYITSSEFVIPANETRLWWPNGFGKQELYNLNISLVSLASDEETWKSIKVGFRTVELVQEPLKNDTEGLSFYFKVNGVPIFAKGSNWIPGNVLPELGADPGMLRHTLLSAKETHMNMLRVWGGGVYESDLFYQLADEYGILIWQDMMFACAMYPTGDSYIKSVQTEVEQQVKRLQHHPSIAIWAGNNENEAALRGNWYGTDSDFELYKADYIKLYVDVIKKVVNENDPTRTYVVSSPSNGVNSEQQGYVADNPYSSLYGDVHYYNYGSDGWDSSTFPDTRFASEYGYQAMPSFISLQQVSEPSDWSIASEFTQMRQHHPGGYDEMSAMIRLHLPLPEDDGTSEFYEKFIYFSQITQGMSTKTESERYRRDRSKLTSSNNGNTMGALYWQLNDVWEAPTWASIEFNGRWKLLHYLAKKFFAPILVVPEVTPAGEVNVYLVSDLLEDIPDLHLDIAVIPYNSFEPLSVITHNVSLTQASSKVVWSFPTLDALISNAGGTKTSCLIQFTLGDSQTLSENIYYPSSFTDVSLTPSGLYVVILSVEDDRAILFVGAESIAPFVWLETAEKGVFSDNGFSLTTPLRQITFENRGEKINETLFRETLTYRDLTDASPKNVKSSKDADHFKVLLV